MSYLFPFLVRTIPISVFFRRVTASLKYTYMQIHSMCAHVHIYIHIWSINIYSTTIKISWWLKCNAQRYLLTHITGWVGLLTQNSVKLKWERCGYTCAYGKWGSEADALKWAIYEWGCSLPIPQIDNMLNYRMLCKSQNKKSQID